MDLKSINQRVKLFWTQHGLKVLQTLLFIGICYICACFAAGALGERMRPYTVLPLMFALCIFCTSKVSYYFIVLPSTIFLALYGPIGFSYGKINTQAVLSANATNYQESIEFLSLLPIESYLKSFSIILLAALAFYISRRFSIQPWKNKIFIIFSTVCLIISSKPTTFFNEAILAFKEKNKTGKMLAKSISANDWGLNTGVYAGIPNKDYILIIGESARRDYFHTYGYPVENTPFLDQAKATVVDGLLSGGDYTIASLSLMLTDSYETPDSPRFDRNLIDLVKSAGIQTFWLTNQGMSGKFDSAVSEIAQRADHLFSITNGSYNDKKTSDMMLLRPLQNFMKTSQSDNARFFVLHTIGSHPDACLKLDSNDLKYLSNDSKHNYLACYVSTIRKTDEFIKQVYDLFEKNNHSRAFSIVYFSDHGQSHHDIDYDILMDNFKLGAFHRDVPLVLLDSQSKQRRILKSNKSSLHFTSGIANWMGIRHKKLKNYMLFDGINDPQAEHQRKTLLLEKRNKDFPIDISHDIL